VAVRAALEDLPRPPAALVGLGLQKNKPWFRLESRARGRYEGERTDNSGETASEAVGEIGPDFETDLDLELLAAALRAAGAEDVRLSDDAGGYVCERTYHALLAAGQLTGSPALFLHLPPPEAVDVETQTACVRRMIAALVAQGVS
jgi:pyrrolidone-carboxylate peptidase